MKSSSIKRTKALAGLKQLLSGSLSSSNIARQGVLRDQLVNPYKYAEALLEAVHQPVVILDNALTIRSANKAFYKTFKLTKKQTLGSNLLTIAHHNEQVKDLAKRLQALSTENASFEEFELVYNIPKLGIRTLLINAKRILLGKLATDFILLGIEDVTKRKMIDQQKDDFIGYVTHELKTPVTTVTAYLQILQGYHNKTGDTKSQFLISKIAGQIDRLIGLLNSFASVYKTQHGKMVLQKRSLDLNKLVRDVVEAFQYTTTTHSLVIKGAVTKQILADKDRIHEVLANLITNAIKYSPKADKVIIKLTENDKDITVSVKDYGYGITRDEQKKVFERFFRGKGKTENKIEGLGLGLYIISEIIKEHKGKIWVKSEFGEGSTFSFSLPIKP